VEAHAWNLTEGSVPLDLIRRRTFPAYIYSTIDEAPASRRLLQRREHKPLGLTCRLDEAAIFTALILILPTGSSPTLHLSAPRRITAP